MDIFYTDHAKRSINKRKVHLVWIEETIKYPDRTIKSEGKYYLRKKLNGYTLEVVCEKKENYIKVITLYWI